MRCNPRHLHIKPQPLNQHPSSSTVYPPAKAPTSAALLQQLLAPREAPGATAPPASPLRRRPLAAATSRAGASVSPPPRALASCMGSSPGSESNQTLWQAACGREGLEASNLMRLPPSPKSPTHEVVNFLPLALSRVQQQGQPLTDPTCSSSNLVLVVHCQVDCGDGAEQCRSCQVRALPCHLRGTLGLA